MFWIREEFATERRRVYDVARTSAVRDWSSDNEVMQGYQSRVSSSNGGVCEHDYCDCDVRHRAPGAPTGRLGKGPAIFTLRGVRPSRDMKVPVVPSTKLGSTKLGVYCEAAKRAAMLSRVQGKQYFR